MRSIATVGILLIMVCSVFQSCDTGKRNKKLENFQYLAFKDSLKNIDSISSDDTSNLFDADEFTPGIDSLDTLLKKIDTIWRRELIRMEKADTSGKGISGKTSTEEKAIAKLNVAALDSFLKNKQIDNPSSCGGIDCLLYAEIIKSRQILFLYIEGELIDSFKVSTGKGKYETPELNVRPSGPLFIKYTSKKFPGGNYQGLGNMPYVVFVRGGYAIHGTTPGNFSKLGTKASHGCIRLHPDNAKIFFELVKRIGLDNTWVTVSDSLSVKGE